MNSVELSSPFEFTFCVFLKESLDPQEMASLFIPINPKESHIVLNLILITILTIIIYLLSFHCEPETALSTSQLLIPILKIALQSNHSDVHSVF